MSIFVDNITLAAKSKEALDKTVEKLSKHFPLRDLGSTLFLLSIHITRDFEKRTIALSQCQYIINMLDHFSHTNCRPVSTLMDPRLCFTAAIGATTDEDKAYMLTVPYFNAIGALMYLVSQVILTSPMLLEFSLTFLPILALPIGKQSNTFFTICKGLSI